jgi:hypothetical protein
MKALIVRGEETLVEDCILPGSGLCPLESRRRVAAVDMLRRIPEDDYQKLVAAIDDWQWFIPTPTQ